ncbi:MAG: hypothetical protein IJJ68_01525 [Prevotella sp.]|nr:hypothetical protein [Prevotella sp.]
MKRSTISRFPDGTITQKYVNGYVFEGYADVKDEPLSGTLTTPNGEKYDIPDFKGEYIIDVINMIENGELKKYKRKDHETV